MLGCAAPCWSSLCWRDGAKQDSPENLHEDKSFRRSCVLQAELHVPAVFHRPDRSLGEAFVHAAVLSVTVFAFVTLKTVKPELPSTSPPTRNHVPLKEFTNCVLSATG